MFSRLADRDELAADQSDSAPFMPKAIITGLAPAAAHGPIRSWADTILYELHVKGFTKLHPDVPEPLRGTFAGLGHPSAIDHLVKLGITTVEVLPAAAWIEERHLAGLNLSNYWGYNPVAFVAPEPRLAPGGWTEIRNTVSALASAGVETVVDVVLNHSGEGDEKGPTLSLRGLDNSSYYRLRSEDARLYIDDSGCGNTLALDRPPVVRLAMDALRTWVREAGVHGFRFDLATCLGRRDQGFDEHAPLIAAIGQDPELRALKLIAEPWDIGPGGYQLGKFPSQWGEWNDRFRDDSRRFWRGDPHRLGALASRLAGSADLFGRRRPPSGSINFVTAHDGFSLADLVSHVSRRNEANGENNRDGSRENFSWNCGQEGAHDDPAILSQRARDQRALLATLLFSRGTPMLSMGSELGHSQGGNNNCYAQDNELSWVDWGAKDSALLEFTRALAEIRRTHPLLRTNRVLEDSDVAWLRPDGRPMMPEDWDEPNAGSLAMVLQDSASRLAILLHRGPQRQRFALPAGSWRVLLDSASGKAGGPAGTEFEVSPRSVVLMEETTPRGLNGPVRSTTLQRLAQQAGVQPEWWSIDGVGHKVSEDTTRHLLRAMRLPANSEAEARESLERLSDMYERRALPPVLVVREGNPLPLSDNVHIETDQGVAVPRDRLGIGRYRLFRDHAPEVACRLTIAPERAWLPDKIRSSERMFGIAAQLYSVCRDGDQGVGDFTSLAELARNARDAGADALGINPLHALFQEDRNRASPYSPSDRRFLDPIYLDVGASSWASGEHMVDYEAVWRAKEAVLRERFAREADELRPAPNTRTFATFCTLSRHFKGAAWQHWPAAYRDPATAAVASFAEEHDREIRFQAWLQHLCQKQLAEAAKAASGMGVGLYGDLAVGAAPDGAEVWASQSLFAEGVSIGAPPDPFAPEGQVWSLPPFDPHALRASGYDPFVQLLQANMAHAGALRIDHAMGLSRLFWIPEGADGKDGAYVTYPFEDLLGEAALASTTARCMIVAEALGTVPEGFTEALSRADMLSYRVMLLERDGDAFRNPGEYPRLSLACVTSHDLPTFAGWWNGADLKERQQLGFIDDTSQFEAVRVREKAALSDAIAQHSLGDDLTAACTEVHASLASSPSSLIMVQAEELALEVRAVNMPGTDRERPNWRRRLSVDIQRLFQGHGAVLLSRVRMQRKNSAPYLGDQPDRAGNG
jgi:glycogen operon protein